MQSLSICQDAANGYVRFVHFAVGKFCLKAPQTVSKYWPLAHDRHAQGWHVPTWNRINGAAGEGGGDRPRLGRQAERNGGERTAVLGAALSTILYVDNFHRRMLGGKGESREPSRDPPPTPALLRWGRGRPWRLCRLLSAELKPNYPQLINLEPIRIFPTTCTCSQEPGRGRRDGAHSGHSGEGEGAAGWVRRTPRPAQEARQRSPGPWCLAAVLLPGGGPP